MHLTANIILINTMIKMRVVTLIEKQPKEYELDTKNLKIRAKVRARTQELGMRLRELRGRRSKRMTSSSLLILTVTLKFAK